MKKMLFIATLSLGFPLFLFAQNLTTSYAPTSYANECVNLTYNLRLGSRDAYTEYQVSALQDFLSPTYLHLPVGPTGYFGGATFSAVKRFQRDYGISQTGYVGPVTRAKIKELTCSGGGWGGVCPMDVKVCPNGTTVSRIPPTCEFATCSGTQIQQAPIINSIYPSSAQVGGQVTISGSGFSSLTNEIYLNNQSAGQAYLTGANTLTFTIPRAIGTPCPPYVYCIQGSREVTPGTYSVKVVNANGTSNSVNLIVTTTSTVVPPIIPPINPTASFSASATSGPAPLSVQFYADRQVTSCESNVPFTVDFGDGSARSRMEINGISSPTTNWGTTGTPCGGYFTTHAYAQPGTYTARLYKTVYNNCTAAYGTVCPLWYSREEQVGTITIAVTQTQSQTPVITSVYSVRTNATGTVYVGEEARITGSNLSLMFPPSGIGARLDVQIGGITVSPTNAIGTSLSFTVPNLAPGTHTVTVTNSYGISNAYTVTVVSLTPITQPVIASSTANPSSISMGQSSTLSWSVTPSGTPCTINGISVSGTSFTTGSLFSSATYVLRCTNTAGFDEETITVSMNATGLRPSIVSFSANPQSREMNQDSTLYWSTQNALTCSINGTTVPLSGNISIRSIAGGASATTYTLTCTGSGGTASRAVEIPIFIIDCQEGYYPVNGVCVPQMTFCQSDAKICPGGTVVGRVPPLCQFEECPSYAE